MKFFKQKGIVMELVRFVIIGLYSTLIDFAIEGWLTSIFSGSLAGAGHVAAFFIMFVISVIGFLVANPANWSLSSVWGFRNVEEEAEKKARSLKGVLIFTFWSFVGLVLGAIIQFIGYMTCIEWSGWNINILSGFNFDVMFNQGHIEVFFAWLVVLVIRTAFTMVFNYVTRKLFIYKAPKQPEAAE